MECRDVVAIIHRLAGVWECIQRLCQQATCGHAFEPGTQCVETSSGWAAEQWHGPRQGERQSRDRRPRRRQLTVRTNECSVGPRTVSNKERCLRILETGAPG